jgi:hypothetical protein
MFNELDWTGKENVADNLKIPYYNRMLLEVPQPGDILLRNLFHININI